MAKRRLGRGLDSLLGGPDSFTEVEQSIGTTESAAGLVQLAPADVQANPFQPRGTIDPLELQGLVESLQQHGVLQPIVVRRQAGSYQLVAGERRLRAAEQAGLNEVPARVLEVDDRQMAELAIVENLQRTDLNPIEKARAFQNYLANFDAKQDELASRVGVDRSTVSNFIRLLDLPQAIQQAVELGKLSQGHARALLSCPDPQRQHLICQQILKNGLSVRQVEAIVAAEKAATGGTKKRETGLRTRYLLELEARLRERLGTQVEIRPSSKNSGQITVRFSSNDDFERILEIVLGDEYCKSAAA